MTRLAFTLLGFCTTAALVGAGAPFSVIFEVLAFVGLCIALYYIESRLAERWRERAALLGDYLLTAWFYFSVARVVPALGSELWDVRLAAIDRWLLGDIPAGHFRALISPGFTDFASASYLLYHLGLHGALAAALWQGGETLRGLRRGVFLGYAVGFTIYLLVPAVGPYRADAEFVANPLTGGALTWFNAALVAGGSPGYDVFPSLHAGISALLCVQCARYHRAWAVPMLVATLLTIFAAGYLRYHYYIDFAAGLTLAAAVTLFDAFLKRRSGHPGARATDTANLLVTKHISTDLSSPPSPGRRQDGAGGNRP